MINNFFSLKISLINGVAVAELRMYSEDREGRGTTAQYATAERPPES